MFKQNLTGSMIFARLILLCGWLVTMPIIADPEQYDNSTLLHKELDILSTPSSPSSEQLKPELLALHRLYAPAEQGLLWVDESNLHVNKALNLLESAADNALLPIDYEVDRLQRRWQKLQHIETPTFQDLLQFDVALTQAVMHFLTDLRWGRARAKSANFGFERNVEMNAIIRAILNLRQGEKLQSIISTIEPDVAIYRDLKKALRLYRHLAESTVFEPIQLEHTLKAGDTHEQLPLIKRHLAAIGLLKNLSSKQDPALVYDDSFIKAVKLFQFQHGLSVDGILGKKSLAALNTPWEYRARQIELAMERIRWWPKTKNSQAVILVNIPAYHLWVFETGLSKRTSHLSMNVIVGQAKKNHTPIFTANLLYVVFRPYWQVPNSIAKTEILPILRKNDNYLLEQNMELVTSFNPKSLPQDISEESLSLLRRGRMKIRQLPGANNSLGLIKFIFPNKYAVYLHDTPAKYLFSKERRDFSHGCVRVEKPQQLATFILDSPYGWSKSRVTDALQHAQNLWVDVHKPISVLIAYTTAHAIDDQVYFFNDVYHYDEALNQALYNQSSQESTKMYMSRNKTIDNDYQ